MYRLAFFRSMIDSADDLRQADCMAERYAEADARCGEVAREILARSMNMAHLSDDLSGC
jgi:hypothetical protein